MWVSLPDDSPSPVPASSLEELRGSQIWGLILRQINLGW